MSPSRQVDGLTRRQLLQLALQLPAAFASGAPRAADEVPVVTNVTGLYPVSVAAIRAPRSTEEVRAAIRDWPGRIAIGGGRYSMGGQVAVPGGLHLDLRGMSRAVWFKPNAKRVRVQAGMRWRDLQDLIDPHGLSVRTMQSYANFTVGGSLAVNAHGRYVGNGPVCNSVRAVQVVLADGSVHEATRDANAELFAGVLGTYGALGVISEVELELATNARIERHVDRPALEDYAAYFDRNVRADATAIFHNVDLVPPGFDAPTAITWRETRKPLTVTERLVPREGTYVAEKGVLWALTELPAGGGLRSKVVDPKVLSGEVVKWRNHEASLDVAALEPFTRRFSTYALQEYFIPVRNFLAFAGRMREVLVEREVEAVNVSIRHSPPDETSILPWAKEEVFSFVLFHKQRTHDDAVREVGEWTRELIDAALGVGGRYYLPYQLHATCTQFEQAYPEVGRLRHLKRRFDPQRRFSNSLWEKYL